MINDINKKSDTSKELHIGDSEFLDPHVVDDFEDNAAPVLEAGSGGGPSPPPPPDYEAQANAEMKVERERARIADENRIRDEEKAAKEEEAKRGRYQSGLSSAYSNAQNYGSGRLRALGIDDEFGIMPAYYAELDRIKSTVPDLDPNPGSYFGPAAFETALGGQREAQRKKLTRGYESVVGPGFDTSMLADTADDPFLQAIIGEQYQSAMGDLDRARGRGKLNEIGYEDALKGLNQAKAGALGKAQTMGMGVLERGREKLREADKANREQISNYDFGDRFDSSTAAGRVRKAGSDFSLGLEGDIRNTIGDTQFFDPNALITRGGRTQGPINPGNPLANAMLDDEIKRSTGSSGAF